MKCPAAGSPSAVHFPPRAKHSFFACFLVFVGRPPTKQMSNAQIGRTVVSGSSGSTCHSLSDEAQERALKLLSFGIRLHQS
jgi:hypothetical protein